MEPLLVFGSEPSVSSNAILFTKEAMIPLFDGSGCRVPGCMGRRRTENQPSVLEFNLWLTHLVV